jgi:hypothetical protein
LILLLICLGSVLCCGEVLLEGPFMGILGNLELSAWLKGL